MYVAWVLMKLVECFALDGVGPYEVRRLFRYGLRGSLGSQLTVSLYVAWVLTKLGDCFAVGCVDP